MRFGVAKRRMPRITSFGLAPRERFDRQTGKQSLRFLATRANRRLIFSFPACGFDFDKPVDLLMEKELRPMT
jgi:hypothetical protein